MNTGPLTIIKTWSLLLFFPSYLSDHGSSRGPPKCSQWEGNCVKCSKKRKWTQGIFCANFYWSIGNFPPCHRMWCGKCHTLGSDSLFHIASALTLGPTRESGTEIAEEKTKLRNVWKGKLRDKRDFQEGRDGDHLMIPFECDLCIFRKLRGTDPEASSSQDILLETCIRRMNLDAFWSRAKSTVYQNKRQLMNSLELSVMVGLQGSYEHAGPYEVR